MDDADDRPPLAGDEVLGREARDPLDLVADQLDPVAGVPCRAIDRPRHVDHERAQERIVGALLRRPQADARPGEQLAPRERAIHVVVGAGAERRVRHPPAPRRAHDREHPGLADPPVRAQRTAHPGRVEAARLAVGDHQLDRLLAERRERLAGPAHRPRRVPGRTQPRLDLGFGGADQQHAGLAPPDRS